MTNQKTLPPWYLSVKDRYGELMDAVEGMGEAAKRAGPLDAKTAHLIQVAAAAAIRSQGAVHSHTRRALDAGVRPEEIGHAIVLLTSTIGFPTVSAALSWVEDITRERER